MSTHSDYSGDGQPSITVDKATLTPLVCRALDSNAIEIVDWTFHQLHGGAQDNSRLFRFTGNANKQGEALQWSLVLKIIRWGPAFDDPSNIVYWKREPLAYKSELLSALPGNLVMPKCYDVVEKPDKTIWLWMEDVKDEIGSQWPLSRYGLAARHLGQFNGVFLTERPLPSWPWLRSGWLRAYTAQAAPGIAQLKSAGDHPLVRRIYPPDVARNIFKLWDEREMFLDAFDRLPQTLCHGDAFRRNLFARRSTDGQEQTVAIDWAFMGIGAIGEEIVAPVATNIGFFEIELDDVQELEKLVFEGYLEGLNDVGWRGDPRTVRFCYAVASALRYALPISNLDYLFDENQHAFMEEFFKRPFGELLNYWGNVGRYLLDLAEEGRKLRSALK